MKYSKHTITALLIILNDYTINGHKVSVAVQSIILFFRLDNHANSLGFKNVPDVGVLDVKHRRTSDMLPCPATCTDQALCDCIRAYYSEGEESCFSVMLSGCRNDKFASCAPVGDSKDEYAGQDRAKTYLLCPILECLDASGIQSFYEDVTTYSCYCESLEAMCTKCYQMKASVPYCDWLLSNYEAMCSDLVDCCKSQTSPEENLLCFDAAITKVVNEYYDIEMTDMPSNRTAQSVSVSTSKAETPDSLSSVGSKRSWIDVKSAMTTLMAAALAQFNL